jgi:hypothetical protein
MVEYAAMWIQHMQKALNEMNLHLHHVLSDISGRSGLAILDAILAGERDPKNWPRWQIVASRKAKPICISMSCMNSSHCYKPYCPCHIFGRSWNS